MAVKVATENPHVGHYLLGEMPLFSREEVTVSGGPYQSGTVLGCVTETGEYTQFDPAQTDGREIPSGILYQPTESISPVESVANVRLTVVRKGGLIWPENLDEPAKIKAVEQLKQRHIIPR